MSSPGTVLDAQLQHLLGIVAQYRDTRCQEQLDQALEAAQQRIDQAHSAARSRVHESFQSLREEVDQQRVTASAQQQTRLRQRQQQQDCHWLTGAWPALQSVLASRWQDADSRRQWIDGLVERAAVTLIDQHWQIECPQDWPEQERTALADRLRVAGYDAPVFTDRQDITIGLRINAGGGCIDATPAGLLRDRTRIEALLLAGLNTLRQAPA